MALRLKRGMGESGCMGLQQLGACCDSCAAGGSCGRGLAGCSCGGKCGGMGLFDTGPDFTGWSWPEWAVAIFGGYALLSVVFTTRRASRTLAAIPGERRKRKAADLRKRASELTKKKGGWF